jgi:hypothetical protein
MSNIKVFLYTLAPPRPPTSHRDIFNGKCWNYRISYGAVYDVTMSFFGIRFTHNVHNAQNRRSNAERRKLMQNATVGYSYFNTMYHASFIILYYNQQTHNYLTNYHTATCFDTIMSSSGSL